MKKEWAGFFSSSRHRFVLMTMINRSLSDQVRNDDLVLLVAVLALHDVKELQISIASINSY